MKKLQLITGLFAFIMALCFFASCEKNELLTPATDNTQTLTNKQPQADATNIVLPDNILVKGQEAATTFLETASDEQKATAINCFIITDYLLKKGKIEQFVKEHGTVSSYDGIDLSPYLSSADMHQLATSLIQPTDLQNNSRASWHCYNVYKYVCGIWVYQYTVCYWY
jgi:hypothetical protein